MKPRPRREATTQEANRIGALLRPALALAADFIDRHDLIVPEVTVGFRGLTVTLTGKRLAADSRDAKARE